MLAVVLNPGAIAAAAARMGIAGEAALVAHLGMPLAPVTLELIATLVTRLPITAAGACRLLDQPSEWGARLDMSTARLWP